MRPGDQDVDETTERWEASNMSGQSDYVAWERSPETRQRIATLIEGLTSGTQASRIEWRKAHDVLGRQTYHEMYESPQGVQVQKVITSGSGRGFTVWLTVPTATGERAVHTYEPQEALVTLMEEVLASRIRGFDNTLASLNRQLKA